MTARSVLLALLVSAPLLAGCGSSGDAAEPSPTPSVSSAASPSVADDRIPDATWTKDATAADAEALGVSEADIGPLPIHVSLKLTGDQWSFFVATGDDPPALGDTGTSTYEPGGKWTTDNGQNAYTYAWEVIGDQLTLRVVAQDPENTDDPSGYQIVRLISEGTYTRS